MLARINLETLDIEVDSPSELVWVDGYQALNFVRRTDAQRERVEVWDSYYGEGVAEQLSNLFGGEIFEYRGDKGWIPPANIRFKRVKTDEYVVYNKKTHALTFIRMEKNDEQSIVKPRIPTKDLLYDAARYSLLDYLKAIPEETEEEVL